MGMRNEVERLTKEAKIAIVKVEGVTKRVIMEVEILLVVAIAASLHLPLNLSSNLPKQAP